MKNKRLLIYIILILCFFMLSCEYILLERDNPLDPKNPASVRPRLSLVEFFVNEYTPNDVICGYAEEAVQSLAADDFSGRVVVLQYHIYKVISYADTYSNQAANVAEFLDRYEYLRNGRDDGLPDIFVNGIYDSDRDNNVQGASSTESVESRLNTLLNSEVTNSRFTIEGSITKSSPASVSITVAKLGSRGAMSLTLKCAVLEDMGDEHHYAVKDLLEDTEFNLSASETKTFSKDSASFTPINTLNIYGAAWIEDSEGLVLQSAFIE